ncbi:MAG: lipocalin family protein [Xanthomonadales bacterium]|nr:lipocalin family protein [Xanthomonadales bacterium]
MCRIRKHFPLPALVLALLAMLLGGCGGMKPLATVPYVDLPRFMGDWYVIAVIPTFLEKGAHNAVESYVLDDDGTIATTFTYREGSFDGERKEYNPRGFVLNTDTNAEWGMRFIWPIKADYRIVYLDEAYTTTIIGRNKRDYVWLMARAPALSEERYRELAQLIGDMGYDTSLLVKVPQQW